VTGSGSRLLADVLAAYGGSDRWRGYREATATITSGGEFFALKGMPQDPAPRRMRVALHEQWASAHPFGAADQRSDFTPDRVAIEKLTGEVVAERSDPRALFAGHGLATPWNPLQRAAFNGYALWTYLTTPFLLAMPGFTVTETEPLEVEDETWRGLQARFPSQIMGHSPEQQFYFGPDHLLRRHDYRVDIAGGFRGVHYVYDHEEFGGIRVPTRRRAYQADEQNRPILDRVMVCIDILDVVFA
jgi:hypothetical protein